MIRVLWWHGPLRDIGIIGLGLIIILPDCPLRGIRVCGWCGNVLVLLIVIMTLIVGGGIVLIIVMMMFIMVVGMLLLLSEEFLYVFARPCSMCLSILTGMLPIVVIQMLMAMCLSILPRMLPIVHDL